MEYGQVVFSKKGRDKGKPFIILDAQHGYLFLADGKLRTLTKQKKKKVKHVQPTNYIADLTTDGRALQDTDLCKQIEKFTCSLGKGGNPIG